MAEFLLLRADLNQQALAQVAGAYPGGIEFLYEFDRVGDQGQGRLRRKQGLSPSFWPSGNWRRAAASSSSLADR